MAELSPGATLGRYRIIAKIGAGGMGEVYRAQDTELGRSVALKFLPGDVAAHQTRVKRFIQEAKAASALNHPNILTVYEIGRTDEATFIATEFVDGITLRQQIRLGLKLTEVLDIAIQIASALVAAHTAGIVHRDIKPENMMVRKDGILKVLDFGLAKLTETYDSLSGSEATTVALVSTEPGTVLGTVAYMSPEQASGREVDARSDIWSLGVVLYEMITSHTPFEGASKSHIIVAITDHDPLPLTHFAADVPEALELIVAEALTKDPEERCQTAKEMLGKLKRLKQRIESGASISDLSRSAAPNPSLTPANSASLPPRAATLNEAARSTVPSPYLDTTPDVSRTSQAESRSSKFYIAAAVIGLIVVSAIGFGMYTLFTQPKQFGPVRMTALTTGGKINGEDINGQLSISPDGKYVVFAANDAKQQPSLWIRQISTNSLMRIVPAENGAYLATTFSPDGELIYYVAVLARNNFVPTLYRVPVLGGTPTKVLDRVLSAVGLSRDGSQVAFVRRNQDDIALMVANTDGSDEPRTIAAVKQPMGFSGPSWSPDGKRIAAGMFDGSGVGHSTVVEVPVEGGNPQPIGSEKWARVGRVIWLADNSGLVMTAQPEFSSIGTQVWFLPYPSGEARRITNDLNGNVENGHRTVAEEFVKQFIRSQDSYTVGGASVDMAAWDMSKFESLAKAFNKLAEILIECFDDEESRLYRQMERVILQVHWKCQSYMFDQNVDLGDFCELLDLECGRVADELGDGDDRQKLKKVQKACRKVLEVLKEAVILSGFSGGGYQYSNGVSVFFPWSRQGYRVSKKNYESLWFAKLAEQKKLSWPAFLKKYLYEVTLRKCEPTEENVPAGARYKYQSGVKFDERWDADLYFSSAVGVGGGKIAGQEGTKIAGQEGTKIAGQEGTKIAGQEGTKIAGQEGTKIAGQEGTKIAGQEGTKIAGQEGTKLAGGGSSQFFDSLKLFKNIESRWDISGFTKKTERT